MKHSSKQRLELIKSIFMFTIFLFISSQLPFLYLFSPSKSKHSDKRSDKRSDRHSDKHKSSSSKRPREESGSRDQNSSKKK